MSETLTAPELKATVVDAPKPSRASAAAAAVIEAAKSGPITRDKIDAAKTRLDTAKGESKSETQSHKPPAEAKNDSAGGGADEKKPGPKAGEKAAKEARENEALARRALRRTGSYTAEEIDRMTPADVLFHGLKAKEKQDEAQRAHDAARSGKPTPSVKPAPEREGEGESRPSDPQESARQPQLDPDSGDPETEEFARALDALDEDTRAVLDKHITADLSNAERAVREARKEAAKLRQDLFELNLKGIRADLKTDFPGIAEDEGFEQVAEFMARKFNRKKADWPSLAVDDLRADLSDAAAAVFGLKAIQAARDQHTEQLSEDLAGQPRAGGIKASGDGTKASRGRLAAAAIAKSQGNNEIARREFARLNGM